MIKQNPCALEGSSSHRAGQTDHHKAYRRNRCICVSLVGDGGFGTMLLNCCCLGSLQFFNVDDIFTFFILVKEV